MWRVTWAHPEFGQVLASCSFDRTAAVWEEIVGESNDKQRGLSHWVRTTVVSVNVPQLSVETLKIFTFIIEPDSVCVYQWVIWLTLKTELPFCSVFRSREPRWWTVALQWLMWSLPPNTWAWCWPPALQMAWWGSTRLRTWWTLVSGLCSTRSPANSAAAASLGTLQGESAEWSESYLDLRDSMIP